MYRETWGGGEEEGEDYRGVMDERCSFKHTHVRQQFLMD